MANKPTPSSTIPALDLVSEEVQARALGLSVHYLRLDRKGKRIIPFFKIGGGKCSIRYSLEKTRAAMEVYAEGGPQGPKQKAAK